MQKRLLTNLLLLIAVGGLATFYILSEPRENGDQILLLSNIDSTSIGQISLDRQDDGDIVFQKQKGYWFMTSPFRARAHIARINAMLQLLQSRSFGQIEGTDSIPAQYQLSPAAITLRLDDHEFFFGTTDPLDERRYVRFNNTIHLINDNLFHQLRQKPVFFVSTRLVPDEEIISSVQFTDHVIAKVGQSWSISPAIDAVNAEQLDSLADAWQKGVARQVRQYQAEDVLEKIIVKYKSGRSAVFNIVSKAPNLILGRADLALQYHLERGIANRLLLSQVKISDE